MKSFRAGIVMAAALVLAALGFMSCSSNSAKLVSIAVTPVNPAVVSGIQFTATGTFSDGKVLNYTSEVTWSSSNPAVATVGMTAGTTGYVTVLSAGTTTITAVEPYNNFTSTSLLTIATPSAITITPENAIMPIRTQHSFAAIASYVWSGATVTQSLMSSPTLTWSSSDSLIATVSRGAVYTTGTGTGAVSISATDTIFGGVSGTTTLTVTDSILKSLAVTPLSTSMTVSGPDQQFTATGTFENITTLATTTLLMTGSVEWTSSSTGTVLVSNQTGSKGLATAVGAGPAFIIATDPITRVTGSVSVEVTAP